MDKATGSELAAEHLLEKTFCIPERSKRLMLFFAAPFFLIEILAPVFLLIDAILFPPERWLPTILITTLFVLGSVFFFYLLKNLLIAWQHRHDVIVVNDQGIASCSHDGSKTLIAWGEISAIEENNTFPMFRFMITDHAGNRIWISHELEHIGGLSQTIVDKIPHITSTYASENHFDIKGQPYLLASFLAAVFLSCSIIMLTSQSQVPTMPVRLMILASAAVLFTLMYLTSPIRIEVDDQMITVVFPLWKSTFDRSTIKRVGFQGHNLLCEFTAPEKPEAESSAPTNGYRSRVNNHLLNKHWLPRCKDSIAFYSVISRGIKAEH